MHNLCKCGHSLEEHTSPNLYLDDYGNMTNFVGRCNHDKSYFKNMCSCGWFSEVDNLTHIELLAKQKGLV